MTEKHSIDSRRDLIVPGDKEATLAYCVQHWIDCAKAALEKHGNFFVALSGGSTPKAIFERIARDHKESLDWSHVHLFWSDERSVPPDSPESNYRMAMEAGLNTLPIEHINRMVAETNIEENAAHYAELIEKTLMGRPFDLMMLGMGDDGHTASLFPNTEALKIADRLVVANHVPQKQTTRMTMTFSCINNSETIALYVLGSGKQEMLKKVLQEGADYPSAHVGTEAHKALWIADKDASAWR